MESVDSSGGRISRYSFIGLDYAATKTFDASPTLTQDVRTFIDSVIPRPKDRGTAGAALIYYSYDAARAFARLGPRDIDPPTPHAYVAIPQTWLTFDHHRDVLTIDATGEDAAQRVEAYAKALKQAAFPEPQPIRANSEMTQSIAKSRYLKLVGDVKERIRDGDVYQLQLGIRFSASFEGSAFDFYRQLRSRNPSPYMFFLKTPFGELSGASPEFLVRLEDGVAQLRPLAGTRPRGATLSEDRDIETQLLADPKERAEHVMLVDLGRNDLGMVCKPGTVKVNELLGIERYSHVMHIVSDCTGELRDDCDALDLLAAGFPAGTVTGTPKIRAMQLIEGYEPVARGFYAGTIGRLEANGNFDSCITLRSVHTVNGRAYWQASAGIVADSDAQAEYNEVFHKTRIIREVLGL